MQEEQKTPLVVDLDGTLILTDMLHECMATRMKVRPVDLFNVPMWLHKGKGFLKERLADEMNCDPALLPYNLAFLDWLRVEQAKGRSLVLCTASNERIAQSIADHLGLFEKVFASDAHNNLSGEAKARLLVEQYGEKGFDYAGNSAADLSVWEKARKAIVVNASESVERQARQRGEVEHVVPRSSLSLRVLTRALRLHQWVKNVLLFAPAVAGHLVGEPTTLGILLLAFLSFGLCASSVYLLNDVLDLESDRRHPRKCRRPIASGQVTIAQATFWSLLLLVGSWLLALAIGWSFLIALVCYFVLTSSYSLVFKRLLLLDCIALALLYTLRIIAGGLAIQVPLSFWLLTFSIFLFLNLAFVKRYAELYAASTARKSRLHGRAYRVDDLPIIQIFGVVSGYTSVAILALYLNSESVRVLYEQPVFLWLTLPITIFWISWIWIQTHRGHMYDDPVLFAIHDKVSLLSGLFFALVLFCASF